jgi:polyhydroxyalkanoate synthesis repressor PhaR
MTHIIKRYPNRKLYSTELSHYVTLGQLFDMINAGEDVKVVDTKTGEDLTLKVLKTGLVQLDIGMEQLKKMISTKVTQG